MRDALTIVAALLVAILVAALAVPPLVDWRTQRATIDALLSRGAGAAVTTEGAIDLRLLPTPRIRAERLRIGAGRPGGPALDAAYLRTEIALTPLLGGEMRFGDARIGRAELRLPASPGGGWGVPRDLLDEARAKHGWAFDDVSLMQLLVTRTDAATGRTDQFYAESVSLAAPSLAGPWRIAGTVSGQPATLTTGELESGDALAFRLQTGEITSGRLSVEGRLKLVPDGADLLRPNLAGTAKLEAGTGGGASPAPAPRPLPFVLTTGFVTAPGGVDLRDAAVELGEGSGAIRLAGSGRLDGAADRLALRLESRRIDLDGFLPGAANRPAGPLARWLDRPAPWVVALDLKADSLSAAGEEFTAAAAMAELGGGRVRLARAEAIGPGSARIGASGEFGLSFAAGGTGHVAVGAASGERLAPLLGRLGLGGSVGRLLVAGPLEVSADVAVGEPIVSLRNLRVATGETRLSGALRYTFPEGGARGRVDAQLALQGLDLQRLPPASDLVGAARGLDLGLVLDARDVGYGGRPGAGRVSARLSSDGSALQVDRLEIADLAGADATASGRLEGEGGRIGGRVQARRGAPLFALAAPAWLGGLADLVPPVLRDGELDAALSVASGPDGVRTSLTGRLAGGPLTLETLSAGGRLLRFSGEVAADRLADWMEPAGAAPRSAVAPGPSSAQTARVTFEGIRDADDAIALSVTADLAGTAVRTEEALRLGSQDRGIVAGRLALSSSDLAPLQRLVGTGLAVPVPMPATLRLTVTRASERPQVDVAGQVAGQDVEGRFSTTEGGIGGEIRTGRLSLPALLSALALGEAAGPRAGQPVAMTWSPARFGPPPAFVSDAKLRIEAKRLEFGGRLPIEGASFDLALGSEGVALRNLTGALAGGRIEGDVGVTRQGGLAAAAGEIDGRDLDVAQLTGRTGSLSGRVGGRLRFGGSGQSPAEIVANLGGGGTMVFSDIAAPRTDGAGVVRAAARALRSDDPLASGRLLSVAGEELDRAPLRLPEMSGPATLTAGVLRAAPLRAETADAVWAGSVAFDLRGLTLDARGALTAKSNPPGWTGAPPYLSVGLSGPIGDPRRTLDVGPLTSGLAGAVLARELDRIDTFEADRVERQRQRSRTDMDRDRVERERRAALERAAAERAAAERARLEALPPPIERLPPPQAERPPPTSPGG